MKYILAVFGAVALSVGSGMGQTSSQPSPAQSQLPNETQPAPENQATPHSQAPDQPVRSTADQKTSTADRNLTAKIRKALMADKSLSTSAHNVKIITQKGMVTLKGSVRSADEENSIVAKAADATGSPDKVVNQMSVKP